MYQYLVKSGIRASQSKATHHSSAPLTIDALRTGSNPDVPVPLLIAVEQRIKQLSTTGSATIDEALRRTYLTGGKLLRPRLLIDFAQVWGTPCPTRIVDAAAAVELLHVATLIHDDIVDKAHSRRGQPTLHILVGVDRAIVVGDLLLGIAASTASRLGDESAQVWSDALLSASRAQNLEFDLRFDFDVSAEQMLSYATDKTAALVSAACKLGALLSSANPRQCDAAAGFGLNFGIAFQLVDDLLDLVGDEVALGKPVWQDIPNGISTAAVIMGRDTLTGQALTTLRSALEQGDAATVLDLLDHADVLAAAVGQAESFALGAADAASVGVPVELCEYPVTYVHEQLARFRGHHEGHLAVRAQAGRPSSPQVGRLPGSIGQAALNADPSRSDEIRPQLGKPRTAFSIVPPSARVHGARGTSRDCGSSSCKECSARRAVPIEEQHI